MVRARLILLECNGWVCISTLLFAICCCLGQQLPIPSMVAHSDSAISSRRALLCLRFRWNWNWNDPDPAWAWHWQLAIQLPLPLPDSYLYLYLLYIYIAVYWYCLSLSSTWPHHCSGTYEHYHYLLRMYCIVLYPSSMGTFQSCFSMTKPPFGTIPDYLEAFLIYLLLWCTPNRSEIV